MSDTRICEHCCSTAGFQRYSPWYIIILFLVFLVVFFPIAIGLMFVTKRRCKTCGEITNGNGIPATSPRGKALLAQVKAHQ